MADYETTGCRAVIPLSDGTRVILGDGTVAHLRLTEANTGTELVETTANPEGGGLFGGVDTDTRIEVGIITDHEAVQHEMVREALEDLGFWETDESDGGSA